MVKKPDATSVPIQAGHCPVAQIGRTYMYHHRCTKSDRSIHIYITAQYLLS